jgi:hypothetical protein
VSYIGIVVKSGNGTLHYEGQLVVIGIIRRMPLRFASRALMERLLLPRKVGPPILPDPGQDGFTCRHCARATHGDGTVAS